MEQSVLSKILAKIGFAILVLAFFDLVFLNWWVLKKQNASSVESRNITEFASPSPNIEQPTPSPRAVASATPVAKEPETKTIETKTIVEKQTQTVIQTPQKEIFIPLGSGSTTSHDFVDLSGMEVTIDTAKYPPIDSVYFEGSIWVVGGNGRAYAQLRNATDGYPIIESGVSTSSSSGVFGTKKITLANGSKTYRVQAKTDITNFAANVDNARLKIVLR